MEGNGLGASDLTTLVPLLLLLVLQFASLTREVGESSSELVGVNPLGTPVSWLSSDGDDGTRLLPRLGRINVHHATNVGVLFAAFALVTRVNPGPVRNVVGLVAAIVWIQLPVLEIDEYDEIRDAGIPPISLYWHVVSTVGTLVFAVTSESFQPGLLLTDGVQLLANDSSKMIVDQVISALPITVSFLVAIGGFLKLLEWELYGAAYYTENGGNSVDKEFSESSKKPENSVDPDKESRGKYSRIDEGYLPKYVKNTVTDDT